MGKRKNKKNLKRWNNVFLDYVSVPREVLVHFNNASIGDLLNVSTAVNNILGSITKYMYMYSD